MSVTTTEHLSAVLDGEAGEFEQRRILDELGKDDELKASLSCYALIGEIMRDEQQCNIVESSFLRGIHAAIDAEPDYSHVQIEKKKMTNESSVWVRPVVGFAMAASVAALGIVGVQTYMLAGNSDTSVAANQQIDSSPVMTATNTYSYPDAKTRNLYKRYLDSHVQYASIPPVMPSVRMVSYNSSY
jgi:sigma-E factor negative regulatory protein RseA